ncbi:hypothetical protein HZS61_000019 [Fusarium oxysporum f. sp. conglutinans]|uniref:Major facilitator superfamily (MFS) profile domain-containing protein n=1 Tax=Fusarium oxysporum f. sp. conglutinans TaxID=100902 RepID=A0A8H6LPM0_FUSOX|nr:hypothetical protein HZS61_000019 [Fusarium oxysporum f. sp. conglutinans]
MEKPNSQHRTSNQQRHDSSTDHGAIVNDHIHEVTIVNWDGDLDPENPLNWPNSRKFINCFLVSISCFLAPLASSVLAPGVPALMKEFEASSSVLASFVVSIYVLGFAAGPLVVAPLSEIYGRNIVYQVCNVGFVAFSVACAVAPSLGSLIAFRFLCGVFGSAPVTNGGGTVADMVSPAHRGAAMSALLTGPLFGPIVGPIGGSFLAAAKGWRWTMWLVTIVAGCLTVAMLVCLHETYPPVLLQRKTERIRKQCPVTERHECARSVRDEGLSPRHYFSRSIIRPLRLLFLSPICSVFALYMAVVYGYLYLMFTSITVVFQNTYGFSSSTVGLVFLGLGIGSMVGLMTFTVTNDRYSQQQAAKDGDGHKPEYRLVLLPYAAIALPAGFFIYGWTAENGIHWIVPLVGHALVGFGMVMSLMSVMTYLIDSFTIYAASAVAANTVPSDEILVQFKEIRPLLFGTDPDYKDIFHRIRRLKDLYPPAKAREFPFGAPGVMPESRTKLVSQLPDRCVAETFLGSYMEAFETMFPLWHESSYVDEMAQFWANPESADWTFFAQVYIMLALGCYATPKAKLQALGLDGHALSKLYLDHASVAFSGSQLTASFNYAGLRTLCMSMLARLMDLIASNDQRDCAITVGLTVRAAQTMNLHRHPRLFGGMPGAEMSTRIKIWTTLVLLDLLASVRSSLPPVIHSGDYDASVRLGREADNDTLSPAPTDHDSDETPFDHILADFLPTASHIVRMANSVNQELDYTNVEKLDRQLRETLGKVSNLHDSTATPRKHRLRSEMFQIIIRRVMLILHEPFGRRPNAAVNFRCSYMRLLECSLALAVSQGALHSQNNPADGMKWALNMFKEDFETALVCIALGIRGNKFDSEASTVNGTTPRDIA